MNSFKLGKFKIGADSPPFIIAEMSANHNQSLARALKIVEAAAEAGVQALKIQTSKPENLTLNLRKKEFLIKDPKSLWKGKSLFELYQQAYTPWEWHQPIFKKCRELGLIAFSTPFDETAVDFLEELNVPCYKIASFELVDLPLIRKAAATKKPLILSTGMATTQEIAAAIKTAKKAGAKNIVLLKCTSTYPATPENSNLLTLPDLAKRFGCLVGLSDHTSGIGTAIASIALGARVIEKHFTLARKDGGIDALFSMEPPEMKQLVEEAKKAWLALGRINYGPTAAEKKSLKFRRSLYVVENINKGDQLTRCNLKSIRPGLGLAPKYYEALIGKKVKHNIKKGTPLSWEMIEKK